MSYKPGYNRRTGRNKQKRPHSLGEKDDEKLPPVFFKHIAAKLTANHKPYDAKRKHHKGPDGLDGLRSYQLKTITENYPDNNTADDLRNAISLKKPCPKGSAENNQPEQQNHIQMAGSFCKQIIRQAIHNKAILLKLTDLLQRTDITHYVTNNDEKNHNENSHPDKVWIPQFCIFNFDFCILKLTVGQFEYFTDYSAIGFCGRGLMDTIGLLLSGQYLGAKCPVCRTAVQNAHVAVVFFRGDNRQMFGAEPFCLIECP